MAPDPAVILQDAQVHVLMALDAYTSGDLPATRQELDVALETLLVADFPRGEPALKLLNQNLPPGYEGFDLVRVYGETSRRGRAVEVTPVVKGGEAEKEIGGPQGLGEPVAPVSAEAVATRSAAPPRELEGKGKKGASRGEGDISEYLSPRDAEFVRKEIARIVEAFGEKNYPHSDVFEQQVAYFVRQYQTDLRPFFQRSLMRSIKYMPIVQQSLKEKGVPGAMAYIAFVESGFRPNSISNAGAVGLWQFMPKTARAYGLKVDKTIDERLEPEKATVAAREYFLDLVAIFGSNSFLLAMASYNAGEGKVQYCLKQVDDPFTQRTFWDIRSCLRQETREYIPRIIAAAIVAQEPQRFGFADEARFLDPDRYELASIPFPTSLSLLATLSEVPVETLRAANADLGPKDSTTPRDIKNYRLLVPKGRREEIEAELKLIAARKSEDEKLASISGEKSGRGKSSEKDAGRKLKVEPEPPTLSFKEDVEGPSEVAERPVAVARVEKGRAGREPGEGDERIVGAVGEAKGDDDDGAEETPKARESSAKPAKADDGAGKSAKADEATKSAKADEATKSARNDDDGAGKSAKAAKGEKDRTEDGQAADDAATKGAKARAEEIRAAVKASREANAKAAKEAAKDAEELEANNTPRPVSARSDESQSKHESKAKSGQDDRTARANEKSAAKKPEEDDRTARASEKSAAKAAAREKEEKEEARVQKMASVRSSRDEERDEDGEKRTRFIKYKVQAGNSLRQIAQDFDCSATKLREWNPYLHDREVKPGDTLFVYELDWSLEKHEHQVRKGDTVASVARQYGVAPALIEHFNGLHGGRLEPGKSLVIYASDKKGHQAAKEEEADARAARSAREERAPKGRAVVYEVRPGNNLSLIAAMFDVDIRDIMKWNKLTGGQIQTGQKLTLYPEHKVVAERYTVKHGDTVPRLAQRYKLEPGYLRAANGLDDSEPLKKGQVLLVYKMAK